MEHLQGWVKGESQSVQSGHWIRDVSAQGVFKEQSSLQFTVLWRLKLQQLAFGLSCCCHVHMLGAHNKTNLRTFSVRTLCETRQASGYFWGLKSTGETWRWIVNHCQQSTYDSDSFSPATMYLFFQKCFLHCFHFFWLWLWFGTLTAGRKLVQGSELFSTQSVLSVWWFQNKFAPIVLHRTSFCFVISSTSLFWNCNSLWKHIRPSSCQSFHFYSTGNLERSPQNQSDVYFGRQGDSFQSSHYGMTPHKDLYISVAQKWRRRSCVLPFRLKLARKGAIFTSVCHIELRRTRNVEVTVSTAVMGKEKRPSKEMPQTYRQ